MFFHRVSLVCDATDLPPGSWVLKAGFPEKEHSAIFRDVALQLGNKPLIFVPNTNSVLVEIEGTMCFLYSDGKSIPYLSEKQITIPKNLGVEVLFDFSYVTGTFLKLPTGSIVNLKRSQMLDENGNLGEPVMQFPKLNESGCSYEWVHGDVVETRYVDGTDSKPTREWREKMKNTNLTASSKIKVQLFEKDLVLRRIFDRGQTTGPGRFKEVLSLPSGALLTNKRLTIPAGGILLFEMLAGMCSSNCCFYKWATF